MAGLWQWYKNYPLEEIGVFRQILRFSRVPTPVRRLLWWSTLHMSGQKRAKRLGTFMLSSYGSLGAEQMHPIGPLTTLLTLGAHRTRTRPLAASCVRIHPSDSASPKALSRVRARPA